MCQQCFCFFLFSFSYSGAGPFSSLAQQKTITRVLVQCQTIQNVADPSTYPTGGKAGSDPSSSRTRPSVQKGKGVTNVKIKRGQFLPALKNQNHIRLVNEKD